MFFENKLNTTYSEDRKRKFERKKKKSSETDDRHQATNTSFKNSNFTIPELLTD